MDIHNYMFLVFVTIDVFLCFVNLGRESHNKIIQSNHRVVMIRVICTFDCFSANSSCDLIILRKVFEFFHNYQNTKLTDLAITSYLVFAILNLLQSLINLVVFAIQSFN